MLLYVFFNSVKALPFTPAPRQSSEPILTSLILVSVSKEAIVFTIRKNDNKWEVTKKEHTPAPKREREETRKIERHEGPKTILK